MVLLFAAGLTIAPTLIAQQFLLDRLVKQRMNLAQGLLSAANSSGVAIGTLAGGVIIDHVGVWLSTTAAAGTAVLAAALVTSIDCAALEREGAVQPPEQPGDHSDEPVAVLSFPDSTPQREAVPS
jgi:predicted MFS family arabinose efflux permease